MLKKLLSSFICFYAILFIFGLEKAYGDLNESLYEKFYKHNTELANICQDVLGILETLRGNHAEFEVAEPIGTACNASRGHIQDTVRLFNIYYGVHNNNDRKRISPIMNDWIASMMREMETNGKYINKCLTMSHNYNVVLTGGRLKNKIVEINEDMKKIRF